MRALTARPIAPLEFLISARVTRLARAGPPVGVTDSTCTRVALHHPPGTLPTLRPTTLSGVPSGTSPEGVNVWRLPAASFMTGPQSRSQSAQPLNVTVFVDFRLAASACVVIPIAAQTTTVVAIIRATVMLSPLVGPAAGGLTSKTGKIDVAQPKNYTGRDVQPRFVGRTAHH